MSNIGNMAGILSIESASSYLDESSAPAIIKNIERVSKRYREYIKIETNEELDNESEQIQKIKELKKKSPKPLRRAHE
jgi:NADPH-dependent ferric siderophore reductase